MKNREDVPLSPEQEQLPGQGRMDAGNNHLLIIAINRYSNGINSLENAKRDAVAFRDCLIERYQFSAEHCHELYDEAATRSAVIGLFDSLEAGLAEEDNLVFYFAGHGKLVESVQEGYWLLADAKAGDRATFLKNYEVLGFIRRVRARHVFGVVDSCFSGTLFRNAEAHIPSQLYHYRSRYLLTSGRHEPVLDGYPGEHSPFAATLLERLRNHPGPYFWVGDLCRDVLRTIRFNAREQTPRGEPLQDVGHQGGEFLLLQQGRSMPEPAKVSENSNRKKSQAAGRAAPTVKEEGKGKSVFISFAEEDESLKKELMTHLASLRRSEQIHIRNSVDVPLGETMDEARRAAVEEAEIILLLISSHFINSEDLWRDEMELAMRRRENKEAIVIPVYVRPAQVEGMPFDRIAGLPRNRKPVTSWSNRDEAWLHIVQGIRTVL